MKTLLFNIACLLFCSHLVLAQHTQFTGSGTIIYEKSVNMHAIMKKIYGNNPQGAVEQAFVQLQKNQPQFKVMKSTLVFNKDKAIYTPIVPETMASNTISPIADQLNTVYTDLATHTTIIQKNIADAFLLIRDTVRKIKWKITDETRDIAGYPCRRANGLVLDSIYVVAFYTDKIPFSGGPESFGGLSGMILELAMPHENVIWKATKVTEGEVQATTIMPPKKGKAMNWKQLFDFIKNMVGNRWSDPSQTALVMKGYLL